MGYNNDSDQQEQPNSLHSELQRTTSNLAGSRVKDSILKNAKVAGKDNQFNASKTAHGAAAPNGKTVGKSIDTGAKVAENTSKVASATKGAVTVGKAAATGAATGGIGAIITTSIDILKKLNIDLNKTGGTTDVKKEASHPLAWIFTVIIVAFCLIMQIILTPATVAFYPLMKVNVTVLGMTTNIVNHGKVLFLNLTEREKCDYFKELFGVDKYDIALDRKVCQEMQIDENNVIIYKQMIDDAIYRCFTYHIMNYAVNALNIHNEVTESSEYTQLLIIKSLVHMNPIYAVEEAAKAFRAMQYPYTLAHSDGSYYTIGDYLDKKIPDSELNNDLNYAEIITAISQNEKFQSDTFSYSDIYDILIGDKVASLLFEMRFYQSPVFVDNIEDDEDVTQDTSESQDGSTETGENNNAPDNSPTDSSEDEESEIEVPKIGYYYPSEIAPYGLNELYEIAEVDLWGINPLSASMTNREMLDEQEAWIRAKCLDVDLGPSWASERSSNSLAAKYQLSLDEPVTGRSCLDYLNGESITEQIIQKQPLFYKNQSIADTLEKLNFTPTGESVILDFPTYINQGNYPDSIRGTDGKGDSIKKSGCIDCTYAMIEMYYSRSLLDISDISAQYVRNNQFLSRQFVLDHELSCSTPFFEVESSFSDLPFNFNTITSCITQGYPVVLHIKGNWEYNGRVYHQSDNGHFLAIIGYDATGLYVYDPGSRNNTENGPIPYNAFYSVNYKMVRYIFPSNTDIPPHYRVNTFKNGGKNK